MTLEDQVAGSCVWGGQVGGSVTKMATAIEFYAGIGGFAEAIRSGSLEITSAWDIDVAAIEAYRLNFPSSHGARAGEIRSLELARL